MFCVFFSLCMALHARTFTPNHCVAIVKLKHYDEKIERSFYFAAFSVAYQ